MSHRSSSRRPSRQKRRRSNRVRGHVSRATDLSCLRPCTSSRGSVSREGLKQTLARLGRPEGSEVEGLWTTDETEGRSGEESGGRRTVDRGRN